MKAIGHNADIVRVILKNAEGALDEAYGILERMSEITTEASGELKTNVEKITKIQTEIGSTLDYMLKQAC
jgi:flagellin-like hook-associated protein FlgL